MRRILALILCGLMILKYAYAAGLTNNASPVVVDWGSNSYKNITFSYTTRNLIIRNDDPLAYVYVDLKSADNTSDKGRCVLIAPSDSIELYDFLTDGISFINEGGTYGAARRASPVVVIATY